MVKSKKVIVLACIATAMGGTVLGYLLGGLIDTVYYNIELHNPNRYTVHEDDKGRKYYIETYTRSFGGMGFGDDDIRGSTTETEKVYLGEHQLSPYNYGFVPFSGYNIDKPVIYVYNNTDVPELSVSITSNNEAPDVVYPRLADDDSWHIIADADGTITVDSREYNYLYWEDKSNVQFSIKEGYCVKGEDTVEFLESALSDLGLTDKEQADFITYWLPQMQNNAYNIISFNPKEYFDAYEHTYDRAPDNEITAYMLWKPSDNYVSLPAQDLTSMNSYSRDGLVIVEWGGTNLGSD